MTEKEIYEKARKSINDGYSEKIRRASVKCTIGVLTSAALAVSSIAVGDYKFRVLRENHSMHKEYDNDSKAIAYFKEKLGEYETKTLNLSYLSKDIKKELNDVYDADGSRIVPGLEKTIEILQKDISRISNSQEFKEYTKKADRINDIYWKGGVGVAGLCAIFGFSMIFLGRFYEKARKRKLKALDQEWLS